MTPDVVVDVGNTRVKWGRCSAAGVAAMASLPPDDRAAWEAQAREWGLGSPASWALTGVHPQRRQRLADWLQERGDAVRVIDAARLLPLRVLVEHPDWVGIDRLLNAVAANRRRTPGGSAVVIGAGTAVTVDLVDPSGAFRGGAIMPGLHMMARALHDHTALLPLIDPPSAPPALPGTSTPTAMAAGVFWSWAGGVGALVEQYAVEAPTPPDVFLTGGDLPRLQPVLRGNVIPWPEMTLEGIRLTAESLP
jgi:type III pantothenate kinase